MRQCACCEDGVGVILVPAAAPVLDVLQVVLHDELLKRLGQKPDPLACPLDEGRQLHRDATVMSRSVVVKQCPMLHPDAPGR